MKTIIQLKYLLPSGMFCGTNLYFRDMNTFWITIVGALFIAIVGYIFRKMEKDDELNRIKEIGSGGKISKYKSGETEVTFKRNCDP